MKNSHCSRRSRYPRAIPTRWRTRSPTPSSTPSSPRTPMAASPARPWSRPAWWCWPGRSPPTPRRLRAHRARDRGGHRLRQLLGGLRRHTCAVINAIGKQSPDIAQGVDGTAEQPREPGRRRPGADVRLRQQRDRRADAGPHHLRPRWCKPPGRGAQARRALLAAPGRQEPGHLPLRGRRSRWASTRWCSPPSTARRSPRTTCKEAVMDMIIKPVLPADWLAA
jgi:hypothetical protein